MGWDNGGLGAPDFRGKEGKTSTCVQISYISIKSYAYNIFFFRFHKMMHCITTHPKIINFG